MKKLGLLLLFLPLAGFGQYDFETRFFTISATSLPDVKAETLVAFNDKPSFATKFNAFKMNRTNYRTQVEMSKVVENDQRYVSTTIELPTGKKTPNFGIGVTVRGSNSFDGLNVRRAKVKNIAYQEMRGPFFCNAWGYQGGNSFNN